MNKYGITKIIKYDQKIKTELFYELTELEKILTTNNYYHELIKENDNTKLFVDIDGNDNIDIWCTDRLAFTRIFFKGERGIKEINNFIKWMNELISTTAKKDL